MTSDGGASRLDAWAGFHKAGMLRVLMHPTVDRAEGIGSYWGTPPPASSPSS
jgi:hypothetical protein